MFKILDCTLRDGGYVNNWEFGFENIKSYLNLMLKTNVDFVEVGFLTNATRNKNQTLFNEIYEINNYINDFIKVGDKLTVMVAYGKYDVDKLPDYSKDKVKNIRYIFKHHEKNYALNEINLIKEKGYNVFINPTFISQYKNKEIIDLIKKINMISPKYYTLVDSMGVLNKKDFLNLVKLIDENLNPNINLAIHLHNNLNYTKKNIAALELLNLKRNVLLDATISGIGRGAGNAVLEDFVDIDNKIKSYIKDTIDKFFLIDKKAYELSAKNNCHPCYATYLIRNRVKDKFINSVFQSIPEDFKTNYNKDVIEKLTKMFV